MIRLYLTIVMANNPATSRYAGRAWNAKASSEDEALGSGYRTAREAWPENDGWQGHKAWVTVVPEDDMREVLNAQESAK